MIKELQVMRSVLGSYFSDGNSNANLSGASELELQKRIGILRYGFEARTRGTLKEWSKNLMDTLGEEEWNQMGFQFARTKAADSFQIGSLIEDFFVWLKLQAVEVSVIHAIERDEAFYRSQNGLFEEKAVILDPQQLLECRIQLQPSTQLISSQLLVISRDREQFYVDTVESLWWPLLLCAQQEVILLADFLPEGIGQQQIVEFVLTAIQKKWFRIVE